MKLTRTRTIVALAAVLALALVATALAFKPKEGSYSTGKNEPGHLSVTFTVDGSKLLGFFASTTDCDDGVPIIVDRKIKIDNDGNFEYDGKAHGMLTNQNFHVDVVGEFVKKKVAKGTVERKGCDPFDYRAKFIGNEG
jgi:hypothetical protein